MAVSWIKTNFLGVRYREHATRKHGIRPDRCFSIRYKVCGQDKEEVVGWSSEDVTAEAAFKKLAVIRENIREDVEPRSIAAMRQANELQLEQETRERRRKEKEALTVAEFWDTEYYPDATDAKAKRTMASELGYFNNWIRPAVGDIPLQKLNPASLEALALHARKSGKSAATVRYILAVISQLWSKAVARGIVAGECPARRVKKPRQDNRRMRFLTRDEALSLLSALAEKSQDTHDTALLSLLCGLRAGEIHALTWGDVDMESGTIYVRDPKNKHNRHAFMTSEIRDMLKHRNTGQPKSALILSGEQGRVRQWVSPTFSRTVDALGLNDSGEFTTDAEGNKIPVKIADARQRIVFHSLRHTFASWLVMDGTPLYTVAELMGHTTLEMTRRYSHLAPDSLQKAARAMEGKLTPQKKNVVPFTKKASS